jgi:6-methylpretetramide 4-monooxygenase / 4-hydroxy-6-methylpretetramide 12a-monooxygenase
VAQINRVTLEKDYAKKGETWVLSRQNSGECLWVTFTRPSVMRNEVLIVGAGPSGLFAAAELIRNGVDVRLVEQNVRPHRQARATTIQAGTLEILDSVGLLPSFVESAEHVRRARIYDSDMSVLRDATFEGIDCRCAFECVLPQYETERILERYLVSLGGTVERGVTASKLAIDADRILVSLVHERGSIETVLAEVLIGAGGAHSVTRDSMSEQLEGDTYEGHFLVADLAMEAPLPRDESSIICGRNGLLLLSPLPGGRWISFQDLEETKQTVSAEDVIAGVEIRLGARCRPTDVAWFSPFRMHRRIASRLSDGRRFLIGDAAHLSSPFGGEGLNSGLHDAYDLAWKLALVLRGHARRSLLTTYETERATADRHVLDISDQVHRGIVGIADAVRQGRKVPPAVVDPYADALQRNARAMIDVDYAGSPLVTDYREIETGGVEPHPGQRYPDRMRFGGTSHHLLFFGPIIEPESLTQIGRRWSKSVEISIDPDVDPARAGILRGGFVLIRPDGHIGFRSPSVDTAAVSALDRHLSSYLL